MEAATLSSPQRKYSVVPVQKSLSLPSYARAGGEGIDHRIIFAALEQREKVRRKSKIFTREKTARQNTIFCLPIPSGTKCRETSFSSDTSCSSLEYQKPKASSKNKKDDPKSSKTETVVNEFSTANTNQTDPKSNASHKNVAPNNVLGADQELLRNSLKSADYRKGCRSPSDTLRPNVNSSDSMDRSSRSSNDSISRKERLVAIKAKVEAAREKYGDTSSEDENRSSITRYNSDGVIHRTVREVKSRSYRLEKRLRRRSQDEYGLKKVIRKNNLSLCLNSTEDGIKLDLDRHLNIFEDQNLEVKTDFCPSPNFLDFTKKNYFSDYPSKENMTRMVQARIKHIEEEERKRRNSSDIRDKTKISPRQSPQNLENASPFSTQRRNVFSSQNTLNSLERERNLPSPDTLQCPSPVGRAPTPPPRSPKSITFVNKAYMQHQNAYLNHDSHSLERKPLFQPNIPVTKSVDSVKTEVTPVDSKTCTNIVDNASEKRRMKELFNARRKTCGFFDYNENYIFKDYPATEKSISVAKANICPSQSSPKSADTKGYFSNSETPSALSEDPKRLLWRSKWEETDKRREYMFNSLESKKKSVSPSWMKWSGITQDEACLCHIISGNKSVCSCNRSGKSTCSKIYTGSPVNSNSYNSSHYANLKEVEAYQTKNRLSKSEVNIAYSEQPKSKIQNLITNTTFTNLKPIEIKCLKEKLENNHHSDKMSATANLDSAMEELESVYRSLKFSSDTLSEKNSESNVSLNDLNSKPSKNNVFTRNANSELQFKPSSLKENNLNFYDYQHNNIKPVIDKRNQEFLKSSVYSPSSNILTSTTCKSPDSENICIDELFNDLTRQLDIEQKLLKESRDSRNENRPFDLQVDKCDKRDQNRMTPLESIVSIRKELYDNLRKNGQEQVRSYNYISKEMANTQNPHLEIAKKKYKAVRSLSENISYLMTAAITSPTSPRKNPHGKFEPPMETFVIEKSSPKHYEHVVLEPLRVENKKEMSTNHPVVPKRSFVSDRLKKLGGEEIRQIRVSMDSNVSESKPIMKQPFSDYPRLSSAVCKSQTSPKFESSRLSPSNNMPRETMDVLDESGLEKLLNTLLNDVPDTKQSSLLRSKDDAPSTPPPPPPAASAGEMRVLQHLDILRLKPIPS